MDTKLCRGCQNELPIESFSVRKDRKDGRRARCRVCTAAERRDWYSKDPANQERHKLLIKNNNKRYALEKKIYLYEYLLAHPCVECGEADPIVLDFDHKDADSKTFQLSNAIRQGKSLKAIKLEIDKCEVRCANCHRKRTAQQFAWWKHDYTP